MISVLTGYGLSLIALCCCQGTAVRYIALRLQILDDSVVVERVTGEGDK